MGGMDCPECGAAMLAFDVPSDLRAHAPGEAAHAALCPRCLTLEPAEEGGEADFSAVSSEFPTDPDAAVPVALAFGQLGSLALNRRDVEALLEAAEHAGADPLLLLDRLAAQGNLTPHFDPARRRHQLEQLLD